MKMSSLQVKFSVLILLNLTFLTIVKIDPGVINQGLLHTFDHYQMQEKSGPYHKYSLSSKLNVRDSAGSPRIRKYVMVLSFRTFMGSKTDKF